MPTKTAAKKAPARKKAAPRRARAAARRGVTDAHKQAMQAGREQGRAIRRYLDALRFENGPKRRGRRKTPDQIRARIAVIDKAIADGVKDPLAEVSLRQERLLLASDLQATEPQAKSEEFEEAFVKAVKPYSERKGVAYEVWRELGVPVIVLRKAGLTTR